MSIVGKVSPFLPQGLKNIIKSIIFSSHGNISKDLTQSYVAAGASPVHTLHDLGPLSSLWLRNTIATYEASSDENKETISVVVFNEVSKYPRGSDGIFTSYVESRYGAHPLYRQIKAARYLGDGDYEASFKILCGIADDIKTPFHAAMAAWPLMRPSGREQAALEYLREQIAIFSDDLILRVHYATALYCTGQASAATAEIFKVREDLDSILRQGYGSHFIELQNELERAKSEKIIYRKFAYDETSYREDLIDNHWEPYHHWMTTHSSHVMFGWLTRFFAGKLFDLGVDVDEVYNFGVMCAQPDAEAALKLPDTKFIGVDRQVKTAELNRQAYPLPNMSFISAEIEDVLNGLSHGPRRSLFHARTATLCYPEKVRQLYRACAEKGFKRIGVFENIAITHDSYKFYDMGGDIEGGSVIYKSDQFIHDYKLMLTDAGYKIKKEERMFSPLVTPFSQIDIGSAHVYLEAEL